MPSGALFVPADHYQLLPTSYRPLSLFLSNREDGVCSLFCLGKVTGSVTVICGGRSHFITIRCCRPFPNELGVASSLAKPFTRSLLCDGKGSVMQKLVSFPDLAFTLAGCYPGTMATADCTTSTQDEGEC